jgi:tight adherence protein B
MTLPQVAVVVFAAIFTALLAVFLFAHNRLSRRNRRLRERMRAIADGGAEADDSGYILLRDESYSQIPFLDRFLSRFLVVRNLQRAIIEAGLPTKAGLLILISLALGATVWFVATTTLDIWWLALALAVPATLPPYFWVYWKRHKRIDRFEELLPEAIDLIVNALKSGFSLESSLNLVAQEFPDPIGVEFAIAYEEQNLGVDLIQALRNMNLRVPSDDLLILTTAISIQKKSGGNLAEVLSKISNMIRERFQLRREIRIRTAQGRLSGAILIMLPIALAIVIFFLHPIYIQTLFTDPVGPYLVGVALVLQLLGIFVIRRIVRLKI